MLPPPLPSPVPVCPPPPFSPPLPLAGGEREGGQDSGGGKYMRALMFNCVTHLAFTRAPFYCQRKTRSLRNPRFAFVWARSRFRAVFCNQERWNLSARSLSQRLYSSGSAPISTALRDCTNRAPSHPYFDERILTADVTQWHTPSGPQHEQGYFSDSPRGRAATARRHQTATAQCSDKLY